MVTKNFIDVKIFALLIVLFFMIVFDFLKMYISSIPKAIHKSLKEEVPFKKIHKDYVSKWFSEK